MTPIDRRSFLRQAGAIGLAPLAAGAARSGNRGTPIAVSTWRHGLKALEIAVPLLASGTSALDAGERGINAVETDPEVTSVGVGGLPDERGVVALDAAVMTGTPHGYGAVASLRGIATPSSVARLVMEKTPHCLLVGEGARRFAGEHGFETTELLTPGSKEAWRRWRQKAGADLPSGVDHDTIGYIGIDRAGHVAAIVSTSGLAWKLEGRVGDSPIAGAGLFVDADVGGACATGLGEEVLRTAGSAAIVERMRNGASPQEAVEECLHRILRKSPKAASDPGVQVGYLAVNLDGEIGAGALSPASRFLYAFWRAGMERPDLAAGPPIERRRRAMG